MPLVVDKKESFTPGTETFIESHSTVEPWAVVFEDDGTTAYFYCCRHEGGKTSILDAVHIYNSEAVTDKDQESECKIGWSPEGSSALLMINGNVHAIVDFKMKKACCRTGFPPANESWSKDGHEWDEEMLNKFKVEGT